MIITNSILALVCLVGLVWSEYTRHKAISSKKWQKTTGKILDTWVEEIQDPDSSTNFIYQLGLKYKYEVNNEEYISKRISYKNHSYFVLKDILSDSEGVNEKRYTYYYSHDKSSIENLMNLFQPETSVNVLVNCKNPEEAVLAPGGDVFSIIMSLFFVVGLIIVVPPLIGIII